MEENTNRSLRYSQKKETLKNYSEVVYGPEIPEVIEDDTNYLNEPQTPTEGLTVATVTAYTSYGGQTDDSPCIAADGSDICTRYAGGELICASNDYPLDAHLYITGYGHCTVADRMNSRYTGTGRIDIYFGYDTPRALEWGIRQVEVKATP